MEWFNYSHHPASHWTFTSSQESSISRSLRCEMWKKWKKLQGKFKSSSHWFKVSSNFIWAQVDEKKSQFLQKKATGFKTLLGSEVWWRPLRWRHGSVPSLWSCSACGSSWGLGPVWGGMLIKINSAGFSFSSSWQLKSWNRRRRAGVLLCEAAGKLNKQQCLFVTKRRSDESWKH